MPGSCPQCRVALAGVASGGLQGRACSVCGGIWLSRDVAERVAGATAGDETISLGKAADGLARQPFPAHAATPPCPDCERPMMPLVIPGTDVELDTCEAHGTWCDRGELQTIVRRILARRSEGVALPDDVRQRLALTPAELRERLLAQYGADRMEFFARQPSLGNQAANAALDVAENAAVSLAVDVGVGLLGAIISGRRD